MKRGNYMTSNTSKAIALISGLVLSATSLTGCATATTETRLKVDSVACEDLTANSFDGFSYTTDQWNKGSSMFSGFGLFRCDEDVTVNVKVSPLGTNLIAGQTLVSFGKDQMIIGSLPKLSPSNIQAEKLLSMDGHAVLVAANETFQPFVHLSQSQEKLTYGNEPVEMLITISANDKAPITFKKVLKLATSS
jgi:hypothetical protein